MTTEANKNKSKKKYFVTLIEACIIFFVSVAIATTEIPTSGFRGKRRSYQDRCFGYQRVITGAIEMYNMDHNEMIKDYNPEVYDLLRKENYLKGDLADETECEFLVEGNLTGDGFIYCLNHGSIDRKKEGKDIEASLTPKKDSRERLKKNLIKLLVAFGPTILFLLIMLI